VVNRKFLTILTLSKVLESWTHNHRSSDRQKDTIYWPFNLRLKLKTFCRWHRYDKADSTAIKRSKAIASIQCKPIYLWPITRREMLMLRICSHPNKDLLSQYLPERIQRSILHRYSGLQKTSRYNNSDASGNLLETHHLMYSGLMSLRLNPGIYTITINLKDNDTKIISLYIRPN